jgi:GTPase SAR1 family protein
MASFICYNIVVFGEPGVGKTCFIDQFCFDESFVAYIPDDSIGMHEIAVDGRCVKMTLMDLSTSFLKPENAAQHPEWAERMLREADGVVLLYDVTSTESFEYITRQACNFLWSCRRLGKETVDGATRDGRQSFGCVLAGNKLDLAIAKPDTRAVGQSLAGEWAHTQGFRSIELDSLARSGPEQALKLLVKNIWKLEQLGLMDSKENVQQARTGAKRTGSSIRNTIRGALRTTASR